MKTIYYFKKSIFNIKALEILSKDIAEPFLLRDCVIFRGKCYSGRVEHSGTRSGIQKNKAIIGTSCMKLHERQWIPDKPSGLSGMIIKKFHLCSIRGFSPGGPAGLRLAPRFTRIGRNDGLQQTLPRWNFRITRPSLQSRRSDFRLFWIALGVLIIGYFFLATPAPAADDPDELYRQGKFEEAEKAYREEDIDNPRDIRFRYNRGCAAFQNSDLDTAMASFSSVLRRTEDSDIRFRTFFNLGNSAFKKGEFQSAIEYYKQAIGLNPQDGDSKHNLELALRELERQKKEQEQKEQQKQGDRDQKKEPGQSRDSQHEKDSGRKADEGKESGGKGQEKGKNKESQDKGEQSESGQKQPEDLSGNLSTAGKMDKQEVAPGQDQAVSSLDRNRAEAMLDNIKENRSKFLQFQIPEDKRHGVGSGKNW